MAPLQFLSNGRNISPAAMVTRVSIWAEMAMQRDTHLMSLLQQMPVLGILQRECEMEGSEVWDMTKCCHLCCLTLTRRQIQLNPQDSMGMPWC